MSMQHVEGGKRRARGHARPPQASGQGSTGAPSLGTPPVVFFCLGNIGLQLT